MKKLVYKTLLLTLVVFMPISAMADVRVHVNIPLPLPILFPAPPQLVVIPDTDVYAVPDISEDIFFQAGWWWRPWNNRWYRSRYHDRGWAYYPQAPSFHRNIPADWRHNYRSHTWQGNRWEPQRSSHQDIQRNWSTWQKDRHWEKQRYGVHKDARETVTKYSYRHKEKKSGDSRRSVKIDRRSYEQRDRR